MPPRNSSLQRRPPRRQPVPTFFLFQEGRNTEVAYFRALQDRVSHKRVLVRLSREVGEPGFLAAQARKKADEIGIGKGRQKTRNSFEERDELILHEEDYDKAGGRHEVQNYYAQLRNDYDKRGAKSPDCRDIVTRVENAEARAELSLQRREADGTPFGPPSTTVGRLTRAIRAVAASAQGEQ